MTKTKYYAAFDLGASSGRAIVGIFDGQRLQLEEVHRFVNEPVYAGNTLYWDFLRLFFELKTGLGKAAARFALSSMGIDTFGCDFGLLDGSGKLFSNPVHYRDKRTSGILAQVSKLISPRTIYARTGTQTMEINTVYQLYSMKLEASPMLECAHCLLMLGDLFNYFLTGNKVCEFTGATTMGALDQKKKRWDRHILDKLNIPQNIFLPVTEPGQVMGHLAKNICRELDVAPLPVALSAYDTSAEIASIPLAGQDTQKSWAYLCCGTWAMIGTLHTEPVVSNRCLDFGLGNEGGAGGSYHLLKNMVGLWIIQQCMAKWKAEKNSLTWNHVVAWARESADDDVFIDIDDPRFEKEIWDMPQKVRELSKSSRAKRPADAGEIARCAYQSLALKTSYYINRLEEIQGRKITLVHMVGGGSKNGLLCQWVCNAAGVPVIAGPAETTATGNILLQMMADGQINSIQEGREVVKKSMPLQYYHPQDGPRWRRKREIYENLFNMKG